MIKIAVLAANMHNWSHGTLYLTCIKGLSREKAKSADLLYVEGPFFPEVEISALWSPDKTRAKEVAELFNVKDVLERPDEAVGHVDGVICADDGMWKASDWTPEKESYIEDDSLLRSAEWARPYIAAGIPAFLDKPLANSALQAQEIISLAKSKGTPIYSASSLSNTMVIDKILDDMPTFGELRGMFVSGPVGNMLFYGQHAYEPLWTVFGGGVEYVQNLGYEKHHIVHVGYKDGRQTVFKSIGDAAYGFHFIVYGKDRVAHYEIPGDAPDFKVQINTKRVAAKFIEMVKTGRMPISYEDLHEINKVLTYADASLKQGGRRIYLNEDPYNW